MTWAELKTKEINESAKLRATGIKEKKQKEPEKLVLQGPPEEAADLSSLLTYLKPQSTSLCQDQPIGHSSDIHVREKSEPLAQEGNKGGPDNQTSCFWLSCARTLKMLLWETRRQIYYDMGGHIQGGQWSFIYQPFLGTHLFNWKHYIASNTETRQDLHRETPGSSAWRGPRLIFGAMHLPDTQPNLAKLQKASPDTI